MDLNLILGTIGTLATIETRIREAICKYNSIENKKRIENIDVDIKFTKLQVMDEYLGEKVDEYIAQHANLLKKINLSQVFSENEKDKYVENFFKKHNDLSIYRESISTILYDYINQVERYISDTLTCGEQYIANRVNQVKEQVTKVDENISDFKGIITSLNSSIENIKERIYTSNISNIYTDSTYSELITDLLNMIFVIIEQNTGDKLLKKSLQADAIKAESLEDVVFKVQKILKLINQEKIEHITKLKSDNGLSELHIYVQFIAADFACKVNLFFLDRIQSVIDCIYNYEEKNSIYYIALGAMGLRDRHSDEDIYNCLMQNLEDYLSQLLKVLNEKWKNRNYEVMEGIAVEEMKNHLWNQIRYSITERNKLWIMEIVNKNNITDIELAKKYNVSVKDLRKELYSATKTFLHHSYVDDFTTSLIIINDDYKRVLIDKLRIGADIDEGKIC